MEYVRDIKITIEIVTNKRDIEHAFEDVQRAIDWLQFYQSHDLDDIPTHQ